jgi:integrase
MATCRAVLTYAYNTGILDNMPIRQWNIPSAAPRDRVLSADEELKLLNKLKNDWLYWPVVFALRNPIRKTDLFNLTWSNVDLTVPWVQFWPQKTGTRSRKKRQTRPTCLVCIDEEMQDYLSHPHGYETVFPRWSGKYPGPVGDFKRHWDTVCTEAGINGFRFHDLRHCATKWMLDNGYSTDELLRLRIHGTQEMIERYDSADQMSIVKQRRNNEAVSVKVAS